jgi:hypothetical protein
MSADGPGPIGGVICGQEVAATLLDHEDETLTEESKRALWDLFVEIGRCWGNLSDDSISVKSSWLEFVHAKTHDEPSYVGEYVNAIAVVQELIEMYGPEHAFTLLFLRNGIPPGAPTTRLAHAKRYVVDEFIRVQVVAGGFRGFGGPHPLNYNGFIGGSRYNRLPRVRAYIPVTTTTTTTTTTATTNGDPAS